MSAGLVTLDGESLYFERTDYDKSKLTDFVVTDIIPPMDAPLEFKWTAQECCARLVDWLEQFEDPILISDSNWDAMILHELFSIHGGIKNLVPNLKFSLLSFPDDRSWRIYGDIVTEYFDRHIGKQHHALHDAKAMREAWRQIHGYY